uniref:Uncharacterized protein n=1 Tax=Plectus sambesii TaxID=2011161 RepID=A0A914WCK5_9BILA
MPCRPHLPPSSMFIAAFLLLTTSSPSICGRVGIDHEEMRGDDGEREKRDGGIISGPLVTMVISGIIGQTVQEALTDKSNPTQPTSTGGCQWFGKAPFCDATCPAEYDLIREHNGRCSNGWFTGSCIPDHSFGNPCTTVLGSKFKKQFCCKSDPNDCTWHGRWMGANNAHNVYCKYDHTEGRCGRLDCSVNHANFNGFNSSIIGGANCDELEMWGYLGRATCGYIAWFNSSQVLENSWYKTNSVHLL